jgi:hypothetical protein
MNIQMRRMRAMQVDTPVALSRTLTTIEQEAAEVAGDIAAAMAYKLNPVAIAAGSTYYAKPWDLVLDVQPHISTTTVVLPAPIPQLAGKCLGVYGYGDEETLVIPMSGLVRNSDRTGIAGTNVELFYCTGKEWY